VGGRFLGRPRCICLTVSSEIILLRLNKESPKKCSLTPLREREEWPIRWIHCSIGDAVEVGEVTLLHPDGDPLGPADTTRPLLLIDSSWRDLPRVLRGVSGTLHKRRLPEGLVTAYPRKSSLFEDPETGLASIEALHAAVAMLGQRDDRLLEGYYWAEQYLQQNAALLDRAAGSNSRSSEA
jgi:rRNA small subunit aminocarboxypropyltransferase